MSEFFTFALVTQSKLVRPRDLFHLASPAERNNAACSLAHNLTPGRFTLIDKVERLPKGFHQIVILDEADDSDPSTLADHAYGGISRVFAPRASGLNEGPNSLLEAICHEANEARCNMNLDRWVPHPDRYRAAQGVQVPVEVADPLQTTYQLEHDGTKWNVANFAWPAWFGLALPGQDASDGRVDQAGELSGPGEIGPAGYLILRAPDPNRPGQWTVWFEVAADGASKRLSNIIELAAHLPEHKAAALQHPLSRTKRMFEAHAQAA